ncbi:proline--tRNA ligase [Candidatus Micrarchaeota archaeon]|nr:proline--tRNA ligase [Candidatus Micrarchaeota archaeon]
MKIKKSDFSEWYNTIIKEAELCDLRYNLKGFIVFLPWSVMSMEKMYKKYEEVLQKNGHRPAWFPALIPESNFKTESEHVEGFTPEVLWVTHAGDSELEQKYAMRPTSETAMYPMYSLWIQGAKDLPLKIYQRAQVWRHETKATKPFIRSREFYWIEAHDVFATENEALVQVKQDMEMAQQVLFEELGIPFLFFKRPQWDKFAGAVDTYAADTLMPDGKTLQLPSTHMLGQNFSKAFNVKYMDENGENKYCWQTCYGPAISRIYAALISTHGDDKGLVLPFDFAPVQIVMVPILKSDSPDNEKIISKCRELEKELSRNYSVHLDNSENTPGFKYNYWEMKGVPVRIELGKRDLDNGSVMLVKRHTCEKIKVPFKEIKKQIDNANKEIKDSLKNKSKEHFESLVSKADDMKSLNSILEKKGGFVRVPFCTDSMDGKPCAEKIRDETHGNVRGSLYNSKEKPKNEKCISCGNKAKIYLYVARQY